jgi:DNA-binding IclR family transcriptional regulator
MKNTIIPSQSIRSVSQAFAIIRHLAESGPLTLSEVAAALNVSPSSCLNLLRTLVNEGVLEREADAKRYRLAGNWAEANLFGRPVTHTINALRPGMARVARDFAATIGLWQVTSGSRLRLIAHAECKAQMRIQMADGQRQPLGGGAVGRALAAAQGVGEAELARRFAEVRWQRPMNLADYVRDVRATGARGYAIDDGLTFAGICSLAVALPDATPDLCLSASIFSGSRDEADIAVLGLGLAALAAGPRLPGNSGRTFSAPITNSD